MTTQIPFAIQTKKLNRYIVLSNMIVFGFLFVSMLGFGMIVALNEAANPAGPIVIMLGLTVAASFLLGMVLAAYSNAFVKSLGYELDGDTLRIKQGVFNWERKAIPVDRVTDIRMVQGIIMRRFGIWNVHVQTASQGGMGAEGTLYAVSNPKFVRETLLSARSTANNT